MKQILIALAMLVAVVNGQAQELKSYTMAVSAADDSLTNADTGYATTSFSAGCYDMHFVVTVTKVSGTVAGNIIIQGSDDNSTWFSLKGGTTGLDDTLNQVYLDTATLANATTTYNWLFADPAAYCFRYFRARVITTGTSVVALEVTAPKVWARLRND